MAKSKNVQTKGKTVKVSELENEAEIEAVKPKADEKEQGEPLKKVLLLRSIRGSYGCFDCGKVYEVSTDFAQRLIDAGTAKSC